MPAIIPSLSRAATNFPSVHEYAKYLPPSQNRKILRLTLQYPPALVPLPCSSVRKNFAGIVYTSCLHFLTPILSLTHSYNITKTALINDTSEPQVAGFSIQLSALFLLNQSQHLIQLINSLKILNLLWLWDTTLS